MTPIIKVEHLVREYQVAERTDNFWRYLFWRKHKRVRAVDDISFSVERGEFAGYIGPNGAGKSTSIKILTGILVPTSGTVLVNGQVPHLKRKENASQIGVVFGQRSQLWWDLPVRDSFDLLRRIYKIPLDVFTQNVATFTELLDLDKFADTPVRQLSLGQKMRADLAAALLHNPRILFLDEPTVGLDVVAKKRIREFIRRMKNERDLTVILTTHDMKDVEEICDRIIVVNEGKIMLDMAVAEVRNTLGQSHQLIVDFDEEPQVETLASAQVVAKDGPRWTYSFKRNEVSANELIGQLAAQAKVRDIFLKEPDIEDIVRDLYEGHISVKPVENGR
jgi:ABC-2 type transport system ATP-binding protein